MTTSQNRQPKGTITGGQFAAAARQESTLLLSPAARPVHLAPGDGESFQELADGQVIETLTVSRSHADDGAGYWVSPSKVLNIQDLIADSDPRLHGDQLETWLETNRPVIEDFLAERYDADVNVDGAWDEVQVECSAHLPDGPLTEGQIVDAAWSGTRIVQLHNESDHGTFGSDNLGRLIIDRVEASTVLRDPYTVRAAAMRVRADELTRMVDDRHSGHPVSDTAAVAIARYLGETRDADGAVAYPAIDRLASRGYSNTAAVHAELSSALAANLKTSFRNGQLGRRIDSLRTWMRLGNADG